MKQHINYRWKFVEGFEDGFLKALPRSAQEIDLPHNVKEHPYHYFSEEDYQGVFTYEKTFDDEHPELPTKILHFDGVMLKCHVYLNGKDFGEHISGYFPVDIDVTKAFQRKGNRLIVVVDSREDPLIPPYGNIVDYLTFGGIYRAVHIDHVPASYISNVFAVAKMDGTLKVHVAIENPNENLRITHEIYDGGNRVAVFEGEEYKFDKVVQWSIENPKLYILRSIYGDSVVETRIGFRDAAWKEEGFFLNGKKVKLMGLNRHQNYPYFGPAAPKSLQIDDADIIKKRFGCNVVRTSHYADDESFLDRCDELGLLLLDEIPGWQFISQEPKWRDTLCDFARRLIVKERNHPCLIAYGLRVDESGDDHELYSRIQEIKKEFDPYRASTGVRNFKESELLEDIFSYNDFSGSSVDHGLDDPSTWKGAKGKPKLVTENNGHMFPTKSYDPTSWRIESALRHARVLDDAYGFDNLCGSLSWCAFDYNTHKDFGSNDHICHHGVADIWRNPKYSAYVYASQGETGCFEVISQMLGGDFNESLLKPAYVLSDCDEVVLYKNETKIKTFKPDRKDFPHLPHPPFKIDDWIGESFNEPNFNAKESKQIVDGLNFASQYGMGALSLKQKLLMAYMMAKKHLSFHDVSDLYIKYTFAWGGKSNIWTFVGIKDGKEVARKSLGPSTEFHYEIDQSKDTLKNEATYDAARVSVYKKDQYGTTMHFADDDIVLETIGPIEIMGPKVLHLVGGGTSIYVRSLSTKKPTEAKLIIKGISGTIEIPFRVE